MSSDGSARLTCLRDLRKIARSFVSAACVMDIEQYKLLPVRELSDERHRGC
jgi:hypothetical protein